MVEDELEDNRPAHTNVLTGLDLLRDNNFPTGPIALDCETVDVGPDKKPAAGRVSIVDYNGRVLYDVICRPDEPITDYGTRFSGIRPKDMENALPFHRVQSDVKEITEKRILVGHGIKNDFRYLNITHPRQLVRDTSSFPLLLKLSNRSGKGQVSLKHLARELLGREIQNGEHDSVVDAQATIDAYRIVEEEWEAQLKPKIALITMEPIFKDQPSQTDAKYEDSNNCCSFC